MSFMEHLYTSLISILFNITRPSFRCVSFFFFFLFFTIFRFLISEKDHMGNQKLFCFFSFFISEKNQVGIMVRSDFFSYIPISEKNVCVLSKEKSKISKACKFNQCYSIYVYMYIFQIENWFFSRMYVVCVIKII